MSIVILVATWLMSISGAIVVGRSPVPENQHHSSAILLGGLVVCLHVAFGVHPPIPGLDEPQLFVAAVIGYGLVAAGLAYAVFRASIALGTRLKPA
jgi:hypothetical protein